MSGKTEWLCVVRIESADYSLDGIELTYGPMPTRTLPAVIAAAVLGDPAPKIIITWEKCDAR